MLTKSGELFTLVERTGNLQFVLIAVKSDFLK